MSRVNPRELRERNISILHDLSGKNDAKGVLKVNQYQLEKIFQQIEILEFDSLKDIVSKKYEFPVVSMYLTLSGDKTLREDKVYLSIYNSLMKSELSNQSLFMENLKSEQKKSLRKDLKLIQSYLMNLSDMINGDMGSLIFFKSGEQLACVISLMKPIYRADTLVIDPNPYIFPLLEILQEQNRLLILDISKNEAKFYKYNLGRIKDLEVRIDFPAEYQQVNVKAERSAGKGQAYYKTQLRNFYKRVEDQLQKYMSGNYNNFVLLGDNNVTRVYNEYISDVLSGKMLGIIPLNPVNSIEEARGVIEEYISKLEKKREEVAMSSLEKAANEGRTAVGLESVIQAQNRFLVKDLYVDPISKCEGYRCIEHDFFAIKPGTCEICGTDLIQITNLYEELIQTAYKFSVGINLITHVDDVMKKYDGIAAIILDSDSR